MKQKNSRTVIIKDSKFGKGAFADTYLPKNSILFTITGKLLSFKDTLLMGKYESYCLQVGTNQYIFPDLPFPICNHSCSPNCGINNKMQFFTLEEVNEGEELTWDYSTSMMEKHWTLNCKCKSPNCRKIISDFDTLPYNLQQYYINLGIVMPFIAKSELAVV